MNFTIFLAFYIIVILLDFFTIKFFLTHTNKKGLGIKLLCISGILLGICSLGYDLASTSYQFSYSGFGTNPGFIIDYANRSLISLRLSFPIGLIVFWSNVLMCKLQSNRTLKNI